MSNNRPQVWGEGCGQARFSQKKTSFISTIFFCTVSHQSPLRVSSICATRKLCNRVSPSSLRMYCKNIIIIIQSVFRTLSSQVHTHIAKFIQIVHQIDQIRRILNAFSVPLCVLLTSFGVFFAGCFVFAGQRTSYFFLLLRQ